MEKHTMPSQQSEKGRRWPLALHLAWAVPAFAFVTLSGATRPALFAEVPQEAPPSDTVEVEVQCIGNGNLGRVTIDPWYTELDMPTDQRQNNSEIMWVITGESPGADSIQIQPKDVGEWPFPDIQHRGRGRGPGQAARSGKMFNQVLARGGRVNPRAVQRGDRFSYNIIVFCYDAEGDSTYTYSIDPDTGVGGGGE